MSGYKPSTFTPYSDEATYEICARLSAGESLKRICDDEHMPSRASVYKWLHEHDGFSDRYTKAKQDCADLLVEEILEIADDGTNDYNEKVDPTGEKQGWQLNNEHVNRSRLRVDARKWVAAKLKPVKYSERIQNENTHDVSDSFREFLFNLDGKNTGLPNGDSEGFS